MRLRDTELYHEQRLDDTGTKIIDLTFKDPLSAISLQFKGTNGAVSNKGNWLDDIITKIEIVDGSDVLLSETLKELQASMAYMTGHMPYMALGEEPDGIQRETATILFGRYLGDANYFMDLTKFRNPQLKITTNEDTIRAMGDTGFVSNSIKVNVVAHVIEEGAKESLGFVMPKEIYNFATAISGDEHIDLPIDYPYLGLMLHSPTRQLGIEDLITAIKISCDSDKFIPFQRYTDDLQREVKREQGVLSMPMTLFRKNAEDVFMPLYRDATIELTPTAAGVFTSVTDKGPGYITLGLQDTQHVHSVTVTDPKHHHTSAASGDPTSDDPTGITAVADNNWANSPITAENEIYARIAGRSPHNTLYVPFGVPGNPESLFKPTDWHSIRLACTQGAIGSAAICLLQLRQLAAAK